jgi:hypothetical protein
MKKKLKMAKKEIRTPSGFTVFCHAMECKKCKPKLLKIIDHVLEGMMK